MASSSDLQHLVVTVEFSPDNESTDGAVRFSKFLCAPTTIFKELHKDVCRYYGEDVGSTHLKDEYGSNWPIERPVATELRKFQRKVVLIREAQEEQQQEEEIAAPKELDDDDYDEANAFKSTRKPVYSELFRHMAFLGVLLAQTYADNKDARYEFHRALSSAFLKPADIFVPPVNEPSKSHQDFISSVNVGEFNKIHTMMGVCQFLANPLANGLFGPGLVTYDSSGSIESYNRLQGGILFRSVSRPFVPQTCPYPYAHGSCTPGNVTDELAENITILDVDPTYYESGWLTNQSVITLQQYDEVIATVCGTVHTPDLNTPRQALADDSGYQLVTSPNDILTQLLVAFCIYNHNINYYASVAFRFRVDQGGKVKPDFTFEFFRLNRGFAGWMIYGWDLIYRELGVYLIVVNYSIVALRTRNEFKGAYGVWKEQGTVLPYLLSMFTILEMFNLLINYAVLTLRAVYAAYTPRQTFLEEVSQLAGPHDFKLDMESLEYCALIFGIVDGLSALSIVTTAIGLFRFLELMPKRSMWNLTGTSLARSGNTLIMLTIMIFYFASGFAIVGEQLFGTNLEDFRTFWSSFATVIQILAGSGGIYNRLIIHTNNPIVCIIYFIMAQLTTYLIVARTLGRVGRRDTRRYMILTLPYATPAHACSMIFVSQGGLFLAIINESYAVRSLQFEEAERKRRQRKVDMITNANKAEERKQAGFDKKEFAVAK